MTAGAWWMLGLTWSVVIYFAVRLFVRVLTLPRSGDGEARLGGEPRRPGY